MKRIYINQVVILSMLMLFLSSCSVSNFISRRNHQPRIRIEASSPTPSGELVSIENNLPSKSDTLSAKGHADIEVKSNQSGKQKPTIMETMIKVLFPQKQDLFNPILHPQKHQLNKVKKTNMDGDQVLGLVIGCLALAMAVVSAFMIIGMFGGNIWVFFVVGLFLAVAAIILGAIGKRLPWSGFSIAGLALGIIVIVALLAILIALTIMGIIH